MKIIKKAPNVKYESEYATVDIDFGAKYLRDFFGHDGRPELGTEVKIPITIKGYITGLNTNGFISEARFLRDDEPMTYEVMVKNINIEGGK